MITITKLSDEILPPVFDGQICRDRCVKLEAVCHSDGERYWTEILELTFSDRESGGLPWVWAKYFYLRPGGHLARQNKRKHQLKIYRSRKGRYIIYHEKRVYLWPANKGDV